MTSFMTFTRDRAMTSRARQLNTYKLEAPKQYDWELLEKHGLTSQFEEQLTWVHENGFLDDHILKVFKNEQPAYKELVVEFLASFKIDDAEKNETFNTRKIITFRLLNEWYPMSLLEFGVHLGLHDPEVGLNEYKDHLDDAVVGEAPGFVLLSFWKEIGMVEYDSKNCREAHLRNPLIRLIHRYLAWTLLYSAQPEKINEMQIKGLHFCMHRETKWHVPYQMALMFRAAQMSESKVLPGGQFVTTIANSLGILTPPICRSLSKPEKVKVKTGSKLVIAMILTKENGTYRLYRDFEPKPGMEDIIIGSQGAGTSAGPSSSRQTRRRTLERREREEVPINLAHVARQNDQLGHYNDDMQRMYMQIGSQLQDLRVHFGMPPQPFQSYPYWDERMGYPQARQDQGGDDEDDEE